MQKRTLLFPTLRSLALFSREIFGGHLINTCNLTVTGNLPDEMIAVAVRSFGARLLAVSDNAYTYDPLAPCG